MRMRFKPYARPELNAWPHHINTPEDFRGRWGSAFANPSLPLRVELGCGKGSFLAGIGLAQPGYNYLGLDIKSEVLVVAKRTIEKQYAAHSTPISNIAIASQQIELLENILCEEDKVQRIYINFCNPCSKAGYAKHRLTHPRQLLKLRALLPIGGEIWFKTDDDALFAASLRYFALTGFEVIWQTKNLHENEPDWNIRTEHEEMYAKEGILIKACTARMQAAALDVNAIKTLKNI